MFTVADGIAELAARGVTLAADGPHLDWEAARDPTDREAAWIAANKAALLRELTCVRLDFETVSRLDLPTVGVYKYLADPSTQVWTLAWCLGPGPIQVWHPGDPLPASLLEAARNPNAVFVSHGEFDRLAWNKLLVPQGWPPVPLHRWSDTSARCRAYRAPASLEKAALRLEVGGEKDRKGERLIRKLHAWARGDGLPLTPTEVQEFDDYVKQDAELLRKLDRLLPELPADERRVYDLTVAMNGRGLPVHLDLVNRLVPKYDAENGRLNIQMVSLCGLRASQDKKLLAWLQQHSNNPPENIQKKTLEQWLADNGEAAPAHVCQVVGTRLEYSSSAGSKLKTMQAMAEPCSVDGTPVKGFGIVRGCFIPHGAHTGRFSASGIQPQNFPRPPRDYAKAGLASIKQRIAYVLRAMITRLPGVPVRGRGPRADRKPRALLDRRPAGHAGAVPAPERCPRGRRPGRSQSG
jgi:hypothetical protein